MMSKMITLSTSLKAAALAAVMLMPAASSALAQTAVGPAPAPVPAPPAQASPPPIPLGVEGIWYDDTGGGAVEITRCDRRLCGRIVWLKDPLDKRGQPLTDGYNPDTRLQGRPICGLPVIGNLVRIGREDYDNGWIYDPKEGKSYDVEIKLKTRDRLEVTGYLGTKLLSESFEWVRAPQGLPRCDSASAAATPVPSPVPAPAPKR